TAGRESFSALKLKEVTSGANRVSLNVSNGEEWIGHDTDALVKDGMFVLVRSFGPGAIIKLLVSQLG
ncbi:hypothetical protein KI387_005421, partial [Taxus chinensis]